MATTRPPVLNTDGRPTAETSNRSAVLWVGIVVGLLSAQVTLGAIAAYFAFSDPSWMVEPDYHAKAIDWDQHKAAIAHNTKLGWQATVEFSGDADMFGKRGVVLTLTDPRGTAVTAANVSFKAYHHARAGNVESVLLQEQTPGSGRYVGTPRMKKAGLWQIHVDVKRLDDNFFIDRTVELASPGGSSS